MASCYVLMLGKGDCISSKEILSYRSNCYFDWFGFIYPSIEKKENSKLQPVCELLNSNVYSEIIKYRKMSYTQDEYRLLQNIILMTDENDDILSRLRTDGKNQQSLLFVSFVHTNIIENIDNEKFSQDIIKIFCSIENKDDISADYKSNISVYSTFDHCEYIIVCDGSKVTLKQYLKFLGMLKKQETVYDILSIYGYNSNADIWGDEKAFALIKYEDGVKLKKEKNQKNYVTLGRFDHFSLYNDINIKELFKVLEKLNENNLGYTKAFLGVEDSLISYSNENDYVTPPIDERIEHLKNRIQKEYRECISEYMCYSKDRSETNFCIVGGLNEIKRMLISTLDRGISKYYVLCILESFSTLLKFITKKVILATEAEFKYNYGGSNIDLRKQEEIINLMNSYFNYIQALSSSMLHNDRKFINADPYQLSYFDIPPRLIAFYTAISHQIIGLLKTHDSCNYTVMLVPDFKQDIYVDSLTKNRDYEDETNLIVIHINEKASYDILGTIKVIAHEIAHHVGQSVDNRRVRAKFYLQCCIATVIGRIYEIMAEKQDVWQLTMGQDQDQNFSLLIDTIYEELDFDNKFKLTDPNGKQYWYYTSSVIQQFVEFFGSLELKIKLSNVFKSFLNKNNYYCEQGYKNYSTMESPFSELIKNTKGAFCKELVSNLLADLFMRSFPVEEITAVEQQDDNIIYPFFRNLIYIFSEGMADVQMLSLLGNADIYDDYIGESKEDQSNWGSANQIWKIRTNIVSSVFASESHKDGLCFDKTPIGKISKKYIYKKAIEYFKDIRTKNTLGKVVDELRESTTIQNIISAINNVISQYLNDLVS